MPKTAVKAAKKRTTKAVTKTKPHPKLPNVWKLSLTSLQVLWRRRWLFGGIVLFYGIVNFVIVQGLTSNLNVTSTKTQLTSLFSGHFAKLDGGLTIYALMLVSLGSSGGSSGGFGYSLLFVVIAALAIIWAIRNTTNNVRVRLRDAYYRGVYPLIPFLMILLLIGIELLPMAAGIALYVIAVDNSIAITIIEKLAFILIMVGLAGVSLFFICSSIFALFIVTLPDMTPIKALRSARDLVKKRRWPVVLRLLYLPVALLIISGAVTLPLIFVASSAAEWSFMVLALVLLAVAVSYLYNLYRELLL